MATKNDNMKIKVNEDGPYTVSGGIPLADQILVPDAEGLSTGWYAGKQYQIKEEYDLCRCGHSKNKPFCDGTHCEIFFDGTETASRKPFIEQIEPKTTGPELVLTDVVALCASARFCDRGSVEYGITRAPQTTRKQRKLPFRKFGIVPPDGWYCTIKTGS